jgi:hypothetical protein
MPKDTLRKLCINFQIPTFLESHPTPGGGGAIDINGYSINLPSEVISEVSEQFLKFYLAAIL